MTEHTPWDEYDEDPKGTTKELVPVFNPNYARPKKAWTEFTAERQDAYLRILAETGQRTLAAHTVGVGLTTINRYLAEDPDFAAARDEALQAFADKLVQAATERAVEGWLEPVFSQKTGQQIGMIRKFDSRLLELLLRALDDRFKNNVEITHKSGGVLQVPTPSATSEGWEKTYGHTVKGREEDDGKDQ